MGMAAVFSAPGGGMANTVPPPPPPPPGAGAADEGVGAEVPLSPLLLLRGCDVTVGSLNSKKTHSFARSDKGKAARIEVSKAGEGREERVGRGR